MLPKANRLHLSHEIQSVRRNGLRFQNAFVTLFVSRESTVPTVQFAFVVSTKISKRAVQRNRTKRLLREAVQKLIADLKPTQVVCVAKTNLSEVPLQEVQKSVGELLKQAKMLG